MSAGSPQQLRAAALIDADGVAPYACTCVLRIVGASQASVEAATRTAVAITWPSGPQPQLEFASVEVDEVIVELVADPRSADARTLDGLTRLLWRELGGRAAADEDARWPSADAYARVSAWTRGLADAEETAGEREGWRRAMAASDRLEWPLACPSDGRFSPRQLDLDAAALGQEACALAATMAELPAIAAGIEASPEAVVLAAWVTLVARVLGREQVVLGYVADGRGFAQLESVLGPLARQLPLALELPADASFCGFARTVADALEHARDAQHSFDPSHAGGSTLTAIAFEAPAQRPRYEAGPLSVEVTARTAHTDRFDIKLELRDQALVLHYDGARLTDGAARRLAAQLATILTTACADPTRSLVSLDPLGPREARWQREVLESPRAEQAISLLDRLDQVIAARPDRVAVVDPYTQLSYAELDAAADALARALVDERCTTVAILADRAAAFVIALVAAMRAGATWVPLERAHPVARLRELVGEAGASLVVHDRVTDALAEQLGLPVRSIEDPGPGPGCASLRRPSAAQPAYMIFTSGSTGVPKAVVVSHGAVAAYADGVAAILGAAPVIAAISSLATDLPLTAVFGALVTGGTLVLPGSELPEDADGLAGLFASLPERIGGELDVLKIVPSQFAALLDAAAEPRRLVPRRRLILGGEAPDLALVDRVRALEPGCEVFNHYGPTETTVGVCATRLAPAQLRYPGGRAPIGRPLARVRLGILDDALRPVATGVVGELYVGGPTLALGYHRQPSLTAARFVADPFASASGGERLHRTGDRARLLADGQVQLLGRVDDQVKVHGVRIELGEVEAHLRQCAGVAGCAVARHEPSGALVAWIVAAPGASLDPETIASELGQRLPRELIPTRRVLVDALPRTPSGKIDRRALLARPLPEPRRSTDHGGAWTAAERALADIWSEVLGGVVVGRHDDFFALGGDSIMSVSVVARARRAGVYITVRDIFEHPTVAALAAAAALVTVERHTPRPSASGWLPLTPNQVWLRRLGSPAPSHFNQALAVGLRRAPALDHLRRALAALAAHHEGLRQRVDLDGERQRIDAGPVTVPLVTLESGEASALAEALAQLHGRLDLAEGPSLAALLVTPGRAGAAELFLVAHHVCVDAVSWRILLEELDLALTQLEAGAAIELPDVPTPLSAWARAVVVGARPDPQPATPVAANHGVVGDASTVEHSLAPEDGEALLRWAPSLFGAGVEALLLGSACRALAGSLATDSVSVEVEGHGRASLSGAAAAPDLSRTVGWLTARYPVRIAPARDAGLSDWIAAAAEAVAAAVEGTEPATEGARPRLSFTYFGAVAAGLHGSRFAHVEAAPGAFRHSDTPRHASVELLATVVGSRLALQWTWASRSPHADALRRCALEQREALAALAAQTRERLAAIGGTPQEILELAPLQAGLLADCLAASRPGLYVAQTTAALAGVLDVERMRGAWQRVCARHSALRTAFVWDGLPRPVQVVRREVTLPFEVIDARGLGELELADLVERERERARVELRELGRAPLLRVALIRVDAQDWRLVWSRHHLVLDGWSAALVLREVFEAYADARAGREPVGDASEGSRYSLWVRALRDRDRRAIAQFWRRELDGYPGGSLLGPNGGRAGHRRGGQGRCARSLPRPLSKALQRLAAAHGLTPNSVVQALYAVVLGRCSGRDDLVFGVTTSGRGLAVPGIAEMVGLLINTLPLRARLDGDQRFVDWARELQGARVRVEEHHATALRDLRALVPRAPLFDTIVVGGNYPIDRAGADDIGGLRLRGVEMSVENDVPLTLRINPGEPLVLEFLYDDARFDEGWILDRLGDLHALIGNLTAAPTIALAELRTDLAARPMWGAGVGAAIRLPGTASTASVGPRPVELPVEAVVDSEDPAVAVAAAVAHCMRMVDDNAVIVDIVAGGVMRPARIPRVEAEPFAGLVRRVASLLDAAADERREATGALAIAIVLTEAASEPRPWPPARTLEYRLARADDGRTRATVAYDPARLSDAHAERIATQFGAALTRVGEVPQIEVDRLPPAPAHPSFADPLRSPATVQTLHEQLAALAARAPDQPAVARGEQRMSYAALDRAASRVARALLARGLELGEVVGVAHDLSPELLVLVYGILRAGGTVLALSRHDPRLAGFMTDAGARLLIAHALEAPAGVVVVEPSAVFDEPAGPVGDRPLPKVPAELPAWLVFTSGSTGRPKGVAIAHAAATHYAAAVCERLDAGSGSRWAALASFAVDLGYTAWLGALATGGCVELLPAEAGVDAALFGEHMRRHRVDYLKIVPSHLEALLEPGAVAEVLPRRALILGGEAMSWALVERLAELDAGCGVFNHYGPSESTVGVIAGRVSLDDAVRTPTHPALGRPLPGVRVVLLDAHGEPVPRGAAGELCVGGPSLALGYVGRASKTAASFVPDPHADPLGARLYRTGDRARELADGRLMFLGRLDAQLDIRGFRVEPGEIEAALQRGGGIRVVRVVMRARLIAYAVPEGPPRPAEELLRGLGSRLPAHMIPSDLVWLPSLPLTPGGKLDLRALPEPGTAPRSQIGPRTAEQAALLPIFAAVLGSEGLSIDDDFFAIGGDSLRAIELTSRLRTTFGVKIPVQLIFDHPSPASLAAALLELGEAERIAKIARVLAKVRARAGGQP